MMPTNCMECPLGATRTNIVVSRGTPKAPILFVGEAPGADEDRLGLPFVGRSGKLLDEWIKILGLEGRFLISNICRCRPPGNRTPTPEEQETCGRFLEHFITENQPKVVVALGRTSDGWLSRHNIPHLFIKHPSYYLRGNSWDADLLALKEQLELRLKESNT